MLNLYIKIQTCNDQRKKKRKEKTNKHLFHLRTTVNRRTLVGRAGRTNEERV
jgi:hypothetical protein